METGTNTIDKGLFLGTCNRSACGKPGATFYNHSTQMHYCQDCAQMINVANHADAMRMFGHALCTPGPEGAQKQGWRYSPGPWSKGADLAGDEGTSADVQAHGKFITKMLSNSMEQKSNIALVAASPVLLEVLQAFVDYHKGGLPLNPGLQYLVQLGEYAIGKAGEV